MELKSILLNILEVFIKICEDNNLRYYCLGGTALGAVRHNGFIPWDDDIDVGMPRSDYDKFLKIFEQNSRLDYKLIIPESSNNYSLPFAKIYSTKTRLKEAGTNCIIGVYLDLFPLDGIVENKSDQINLLNKYWDLRWELRDSSKTFNNKLNDFKYHLKIRDFKKLGRITISYLFKKQYRSYIIKKLNKLLNTYSYNSSTIVCNYGGAWKEKEIINKEVFENYIIFPFEHLNVRIPGDYHNYLTTLYGEYMKLPPVEKRKSHHNFEIFELNPID